MGLWLVAARKQCRDFHRTMNNAGWNWNHSAQGFTVVDGERTRVVIVQGKLIYRMECQLSLRVV